MANATIRPLGEKDAEDTISPADPLQLVIGTVRIRDGAVAIVEILPQDHQPPTSNPAATRIMIAAVDDGRWKVLDTNFLMECWLVGLI